MTDLAPSPISKPDIIVPDTGPLIHLAQADALHLLHEVGGRVVVTDMVAIEATAFPEKPGAAAVQSWLIEGSKPGSNAPVSIEPTEVGRLYVAAKKGDPDYKARGLGELAIVGWLQDKVDSTSDSVLVVYENGRVPNMIGGHGIDADIDILTTRAFLALAEDRGLVSSAAEYWDRVIEAAPTANPNILTTSHRPSRGR